LVRHHFGLAEVVAEETWRSLRLAELQPAEGECAIEVVAKIKKLLISVYESDGSIGFE